jgi:hypothetical protein
MASATSFDLIVGQRQGDIYIKASAGNDGRIVTLEHIGVALMTVDLFTARAALFNPASLGIRVKMNALRRFLSLISVSRFQIELAETGMFHLTDKKTGAITKLVDGRMDITLPHRSIMIIISKMGYFNMQNMASGAIATDRQAKLETRAIRVETYESLHVGGVMANPARPDLPF